MISLQSKIATALLITFTSFVSFAQNTTEKIWVTFESANDVPELIEDDLVSSNFSVQSLIVEFDITSVEQAVPSSMKDELQKVYEVSCNCDADELSTAIKTRSEVLTNPEEAPDYQLLDTPNDYTTSYTTDYALDLINAEEAWQYSIGDASTIIGVSDANYFDTHEDLESQINYLQPLNINTNYYHGTAVAITVAGHTDNGVGKSSIGYNCKMDLVSLGYDQLLQMASRGIRVINVSWASGCSPNSYVQAVVDEIYESGSILVAAAGNGATCGGASNPVFPAACDHVISVTSIGENDNHEKVIGNPLSTHQHHSSVDICAPGYNVPISPLPGYYNTANGSSFAAPFVTGTIGLMLSLKPCLTFEQVSDILRMSSDNIDGLNPAYAGLLGSGRLNAAKALELTESSSCESSSPNVSLENNVLTGTGTSTGSGGIINVGSPNTVDSEAFNFDIFPTVVIGGSSSNPQLDEHDGEKQDSQSNTAVINSITETIEASLFPNPTSGSATFQWDVSEAMNLTVVDARGVIVDYQELTPGMTKAQINVQQSGVYFVRVTNDHQQVWLGKLVRQ